MTRTDPELRKLIHCLRRAEPLTVNVAAEYNEDKEHTLRHLHQQMISHFDAVESDIEDDVMKDITRVEEALLARLQELVALRPPEEDPPENESGGNPTIVINSPPPMSAAPKFDGTATG